MIIGCTAVIALSECVLWAMIEKMKSSWLYYAAPYGKGGGTVWMRAATLLMAYVWINLLLMAVPDRKMKQTGRSMDKEKILSIIRGL